MDSTVCVPQSHDLGSIYDIVDIFPFTYHSPKFGYPVISCGQQQQRLRIRFERPQRLRPRPLRPPPVVPHKNCVKIQIDGRGGRERTEHTSIRRTRSTLAPFSSPLLPRERLATFWAELLQEGFELCLPPFLPFTATILFVNHKGLLIDGVGFRRVCTKSMCPRRRRRRRTT